MTIFFTGVPSIEEQDRMKAAALEEKMNPKKPVQAAAKRPRVNAIVVKAVLFGHGPFEANACYQCHEVSATGSLRGFGSQKEAEGSFTKAGVIPGRMVEPLDRLCIGCHQGKSADAAANRGLWLHGPVSAGFCIVCHGPHTGPEPYMLLKKADVLCMDCHAQGQIFNQGMHQDKESCTACHNPHVGKDSRMLKAEHQESW